MQTALTTVLHWKSKMEAMTERSRKVLPVPLRLQKLDYERPALSLADFISNDVMWSSILISTFLISAASIWFENWWGRESGSKNWGVASPKSSTDVGRQSRIESKIPELIFTNLSI